MQGFIEYDNAIYHREKTAGSTAVTALIRDNKLYCANAGDSRAIACKKGQLITLSNDHKPNNPEEMERIYNAGGWVEFNRVNGNLALSRALGDFLFKRNDTFPPEQQIVTGKDELWGAKMK
jgi:protein phosphatase PTC2/3